MKKYISLHIFPLIFMLLASWSGAMALPLTHYASSSRLASGRWVKISVEESGLYRITPEQLRSWGFSQPEKVHVFGYGGTRIPDELNATNYVDDLPAVQQISDGRGIVFYANGPEEWVQTYIGYMHRVSNIYTTEGYYFLSDVALEEDRVPGIPTFGVAELAPGAERVFLEHFQYEQELSQPGEAGYTLVGESFLSQPTRKISFSTPDAVSDTTAYVEITTAVKSSVATSLSVSINGQALPANSSDQISATANSSYVAAGVYTSRHEFPYQGSKAEVSISMRNAGSLQGAWLDYAALSYYRHLRLPADGVLSFSSSSPSLCLEGQDVTVWDVTSSSEISQMRTLSQSGLTAWTNDYHGQRSYVAFSSSAKLPSPKFVKVMQNQDLHAHAPVDMVIISIPAVMQSAERIAQMHRQEENPLSVRVVNVEDIYNEFSSGMPDVSGLRKYLKMLYDRGNSADSLASLKYVLLMGRATTDNRHLLSGTRGLAGLTIPVWMGGSEKFQFSDNDAYGTDDFISMLADGSGTRLGSDDLSVAVGRIPATSASQAKSCVDKMEQYLNRSKKTSWKNHFLFQCDTGDEGIHAKQTNAMIADMHAADNLQSLSWRVYADCYEQESGIYKGAREDLYRMLDEGVIWWTYIGHANNHTISHGGIVTYNDLNNMFLSKVPVLFAATCDFLRWDSNTTSGGEILFFERYGGVIALISATRPVYISDNGYLTRAMGRAMQRRNPDGTLPRLGEIYRTAKNNLLSSVGTKVSSTNRLRYVFMGDPAMPMIMPGNIVTLDSIDGNPLGADSDLTIPALGRPIFSGSVRNPQGEVISDFNGNIEVTLYDAEESHSTLDADPETRVTYDEQGSKIFVGIASVKDGRFSIQATVPTEIADNFRPASLNMYAYSTSDSREAIGVNRDFYVYGIDAAAPADTIAPEIEYMVLNHDTFRPGDTVNDSPMLIARVSDNVGLNISTAGVGHQMTATLDRIENYTNVSLYFTPSADTPGSGTINFPLEGLTDGAHTLRLRVWDTAGNSTSREIDFFVQQGLAPKIFDIYTDTNPASTEANFYISHNRPDQMLTVKISVYNLVGKPVWTGSATGVAEMFTSAPVTWDLRDSSGRRVPRGIYLYRAEITDQSGQNYDTGSRRIAVTAR